MYFNCIHLFTEQMWGNSRQIILDRILSNVRCACTYPEIFSDLLKMRLNDNDKLTDLAQ